MRRFVIAAIATISLLFAATHGGHGQARQDARPTTPAAEQQLEPDIMGAVSKQLTDEAARLHEDAAKRLEQLGKLEAELQANLNNTANAKQNADALLGLLREVADRLAPEGAYRKTLSAQEAIVREYAKSAETHADREVRDLAGKFTDGAAEIAKLAREAEETRTRLAGQIDRLERLRDRLQYTRAASEVGAFVKNARSYLDHVRTIADNAQHLANDLENFGKAPPTD